MTTLVTIAELGPNNRGKISAEDVGSELREQLIQDVLRPEYRKRFSGSFRCVDGRLPEGGLERHEDEIDGQGAGGEAVFQTAIDYMVGTFGYEAKSSRIAANTKFAIAQGRKVVVHGDNHKGKAGCGANVEMFNTLRDNAANVEVVAPTAWVFVEALGLDELLEKEDVTRLIENGNSAANNEALNDITPEETADIVLANGGVYEEVQDHHTEKLIVVDLNEEGAWDEEQYIADHPNPNAPGTSYEAFVASFGVYKATAFKDVLVRGESEKDAALRTLGFILFNVGVPKALTAAETGKGEGLPVVVIK